MNFIGIDDNKAKSYLMGRIVAIEAAVAALIAVHPRSDEMGAAIRDGLQAMTGQGLFEPVQDAMLDGIDAALMAILQGALNPPSTPQTPTQG